MSGTGSYGPDSSTINWVFYPWPPSSVALAKQHWKEADLWTEIAKEAETCDVTRIGLDYIPFMSSIMYRHLSALGSRRTDNRGYS